MYECRNENCDRQFDSRRGMKKHWASVHDPKYKNREWLHKQYVKNGKSISEIADQCSVSYEPVRNQLQKHGIDRRGYAWYVNYANFTTDANGYERWRSYITPEKNEFVKVHRLLAVAEYGFEAVSNKVVHHINGIRWDNRQENITLMDAGEHSKHHYPHPYESIQKVDKELCEELKTKNNAGKSYPEIAELYDVSAATVGRHVRGECNHDVK